MLQELIKWHTHFYLVWESTADFSHFITNVSFLWIFIYLVLVWKCWFLRTSRLPWPLVCNPILCLIWLVQRSIDHPWLAESSPTNSGDLRQERAVSLLDLARREYLLAKGPSLRPSGFTCSCMWDSHTFSPCLPSADKLCLPFPLCLWLMCQRTSCYDSEEESRGGKQPTFYLCLALLWV